MSVGQELLDVPLPQMVSDLAMGIAEAQATLDNNSLNTTLALAEETFTYIPKVVGTIDETKDPVEATFEVIRVEEMPLLAFIKPTWYQFSETKIEVSMDIKTSFTSSSKKKLSIKAKGGWGPVSVSIKADVEHSRKFGKDVQGTSKLSVTLVPVPPPPNMLPEVDIQRIKKPDPPVTP
ncbi:hypothetical protein MNBD_GAMMA04-1274 [hydrothermal vent metagenome]|uniref:DUF2589 domain-containing protein n=1 Tax=hydrothermal vent metagenome TaxID=652676 RepID=A0A3B0VZB4_9ZZZZ